MNHYTWPDSAIHKVNSAVDEWNNRHRSDMRLVWGFKDKWEERRNSQRSIDRQRFKALLSLDEHCYEIVLKKSERSCIIRTDFTTWWKSFNGPANVLLSDTKTTFVLLAACDLFNCSPIVVLRGVGTAQAIELCGVKTRVSTDNLTARSLDAALKRMMDATAWTQCSIHGHSIDAFLSHCKRRVKKGPRRRR